MKKGIEDVDTLRWSVLNRPVCRKAKLVKRRSTWDNASDYFTGGKVWWPVYYVSVFLVLFAMAANMPIWNFSLITSVVPIPSGLFIPVIAFILNSAVCAVLTDEHNIKINGTYLWLMWPVLPIMWLLAAILYYVC